MTALGLRKKTALSFLFIFIIWATGFLWFSYQIDHKEKDITEHSADVIVVLTGANGRLDYAIDLLITNKADILFISGVGEKATISDLLRQIPNHKRELVNEQNIFIGHEAENTIGNAREIKEWLAKFHYNKIILVTSNYHMPRSILELSKEMPEITIIPAPFIANDSQLLLPEYHKYLASKLRHIIVSATVKK